MEEVFGIILTIFFFIILIKWLARIFLPIILKKLMQKMTNNPFGQSSHFSSQHEPEKKPEGEVYVSGDVKKPTNKKYSDEEYIDFEEVK